MPENDADVILAPEAPSTSASAPAPASVLVVDDNDSNRDALCRRLERRGYALTSAADGPEALQILGGQAFDLVLLDVMMPGMSGLEVLEHIRRDRSPADLPVIMATANNESEDIVKAFGLGANDYVTKPLDFPVVLARVRTQVSLKQSVQQILELEKRLSERNQELEAANVALVRSADRRQKELEAAAKVQAALLPTLLPETPGLKFAWEYRPCQELAGDSLNVCVFDDGRVGAYVLDVSGHGVGASLLAVSATRLLSAYDPDSLLMTKRTVAGVSRPVPPAEVATRLDERFPFNPAIGQFITMFYAVVDAAARELTYASAGHPGAIHLRRSGAAAGVLEATGMPIGLGEAYEQQVVKLEAGDRVYLHTDGVIEAMNSEDEQFGTDRLIRTLKSHLNATLQESISALLEEIRDWCGALPPHDDVSVLAFECA
jgi:sigma-B regulation protein RsbU (phosphoserine phosphatase)